ncbi:MAG TPA: heat-inducible transcriptional repressor HrcA [Oscillospiraceae bacterium]|nr:heat-inducible transcriptional repressor HrcA [Oscillospiraceae bacterium]
MDDRARMILQAIVNSYVEICEPVGSKYLVDKYNLNLSSATVRNVMSWLEEEGYLEKPHTSAGRVPSDKGYRAYVNNLSYLPLVPLKKQAEFRDYLDQRIDEASDLIIRAADFLSEQTAFVSIALSPDYSSASIQQLKILMIEPGSALVVVVIQAGIVHDRLIRVSELLDADQLNRIGNAVEHAVKGKALNDITLVMVTAAAEDTDIPETLLKQVAYETYTSIKQMDNLDVYIDGLHRLLGQPEFQDIDKAQRFFHAINKPKIVAGYMSDIQREEESRQTEERQPDESDTALSIDEQLTETVGQKKDAYMLRIGQEIALQGLEDMSFISTVYRFSGKISGQLAVIGPKRMRYGEIISQIQFINRILSETSEELERER